MLDLCQFNCDILPAVVIIGAAGAAAGAEDADSAAGSGDRNRDSN